MEEYLHLKHLAKNLGEQKMDEERAEILREIKMCGGLNSGFFWCRARVRNGTAMSKLKDDWGTVVTDEAAMADLARSRFESLGKGDGRYQ